MTRDLQLAVFDVTVTILFTSLAIASSGWWALLAVGSGFIAYRQLRLATRNAHGLDQAPR